MKALKAIIAFISGTILGMMGGQGKIGGKSTRRFGLPAVIQGYCFSIGWSWKYLAFLFFIPILSMGYGVDSQIGALCGHVEWLIRLVYAILLSIPFAIFGLLRWVSSAILLAIAFQVQAGSIGQLAWFGDVLIEDIIRYGTLMALVIFNVAFRKK